MINLNNAQVTKIQFFDYTHQIQVGENEFETVREYSANIIIDEKLVIQLSGNDEEAHASYIPTCNECYYNDEELQDWAHKNLDSDDIEFFLKINDIENSFYFLEQHGETINV